jgi:hypothetical protein
MEQENLVGSPPSPPQLDGVAAIDPINTLTQILGALEECSWGELPGHIQQSLKGLEGLKRLAGAVTILLTDYGGATPWDTCESIMDASPDLYNEFGLDRTLAVCEDIQYSEIPEQSAIYQQMFDTFNARYFSGRLPDYKILVVYDVWHWEIERCGYPPFIPPAAEAFGFIDFPARQIFLRFLANYKSGLQMSQSLIHEMAHAATDGDHGDAWRAEMVRLKELGAPVDQSDLEVEG